MPSFLNGIGPGDKVRVISGYFKDLEGVVKSCDADRAVVELREGEGTFKARFTSAQIERATQTERA